MNEINELSPLELEALDLYLNLANIVEKRPTSGGVNNFVTRINCRDDESYILRVYNNGNSNEKVAFEHCILDLLSSCEFDFKLPKSVLSKYGGRYEALSNGSNCALFEVISGISPKLTCVENIGRASGNLVFQMARITPLIATNPPTPAYFDLYAVHHAASKELVEQCLLSTVFDENRNTTSNIWTEINELEILLPSYRELELKQQLIHGDLHYDNILCDNGIVTGILDFEFCGLDWHIMEMAICLSKYCSEDDPLPYFNLFLIGYSKSNDTITMCEAKILPSLIILRILSNVIYFVGRCSCGEDRWPTLLSRIDIYNRRICWIKSHEHEIVDMLKSVFEL